jgi:hypothetical protein
MDSHAQKTQSIDTSSEAELVQLRAWRAMSPRRKARQITELTRTACGLSLAGLRQRYPESSEKEWFLRLAAMRLDRETMIRVYGWDPHEHPP